MNTIIEKIRAEVERLKKKQPARNAIGAICGEETVVDASKLLSFLSDLEKEETPTTAEGLELKKEIDMYFKDWDTNSNGAFFNEDGYKIDTIALKNIARHFYELGCRCTAEKYDEIEYKRQRADVCEGLEEAVVDYFEGYWPGMETAEQCNTDLHFTPPAIMRLARHFYELGQQSKQPVCEGLEEEIKSFALNFYQDNGNLPTVADIARHFAKWQKEKDKVKNTEIARRAINGYKEEMLKEAVEGWVARDGFDNTLCFFSNKPHRPDIQEPLKVWKMWLGGCFHLPKQLFPDLKWEDEPKKVKLIIVKED